MRLRQVGAAIERGDLAPARAVFANAECEPWREKISRALEARITRAHDNGDYGFLDAVKRDEGLPELIRTHASNQRWLLEQKPAGADHRQLVRTYGAKSIDDIDD